MIRLVSTFPVCNVCIRSLWTSKILTKEADYHKILGLSKDCNKTELKKRYLELCKQYHPDSVNTLGKLSEDEAKKQFQEINGAYRALMKKHSRPKRVLVQTRGYKPKYEDGSSKEGVKKETTEPSSKTSNEKSSKFWVLDSINFDLLVFMFIATLTIKMLVNEDALMNTRRVRMDDHRPDTKVGKSEETALRKSSRDNTIYFLLGIPMLLLYWRFWNRFGR